MFSSDDDSQTDLFANTQQPTRNEYVTESQPDKWVETDLEYPWMILFHWNGSMSPFNLQDLIKLNPSDIDGKWLSALLSPVSRCKHRNLSQYPDHAVSLFEKVHKSKRKCVIIIFNSKITFQNMFIRNDV